MFGLDGNNKEGIERDGQIFYFFIFITVMSGLVCIHITHFMGLVVVFCTS